MDAAGKQPSSEGRTARSAGVKGGKRAGPRPAGDGRGPRRVAPPRGGRDGTTPPSRGEARAARGRAEDEPPSGKRTRRVRRKRLKRPAESASLALAGATVLVSLFGFEGPQAKEMTAALAGLLGVVPLAVSKLVDWKRDRDELEAERTDLLERAVLALEKAVYGGADATAVATVAAEIAGDAAPPDPAHEPSDDVLATSS